MRSNERPSEPGGQDVAYDGDASGVARWRGNPHGVRRGTPPTPNVSDGLKLLGGCLKVTLEIAALLALIFLGPLVVLGLVMYFAWPWYSSGTRASDLDDALIALASVAGVLWSGAIIAYSIHKRYTPPLRTGVQLLHFAILAPLVGLIGSGWALRTAFYLFAYFYMLSTLYSMTNLELHKSPEIPVQATGEHARRSGSVCEGPCEPRGPQGQRTVSARGARHALLCVR